MIKLHQMMKWLEDTKLFDLKVLMNELKYERKKLLHNLSLIHSVQWVNQRVNHNWVFVELMYLLSVSEHS